MAKYYGQLTGNRQTVTRTGTKSSGIRSSCQSWEGSVITSLCDGNVTIEISNTSSYSGTVVFYGTIKELEEVLTGCKQEERTK